jgi:hypothetical protein
VSNEDRGRITRKGGGRCGETLEENKVTKGPGPGYAGGNGLTRGASPWRRTRRVSRGARFGNVTRGTEPATATDPCEGKPLKTTQNPVDVSG